MTLTAKTSGSATNYPLSAGSSSTAGFSPPSFAATPSGPTLTGGSDGSGGCSTPALTITNGIGRRTGMCDAAGGEAWSYDEMGRVLTNVRRINSVTKTFSYTYNQDGSLASLTYPSGHVVTYTPNSAGQTVSAVGTGGVNYVINATYAPHGALSGRQNGANLVSTFYYNNRLQPCRISVKTTGTAPGQCDDQTNVGNVLDFTYDFDSEPAAGVQNNGNVGRITNKINPDRTQSFTYDELNRIKTAQTQATTGSLCWGQTFSYDIWANLHTIAAVGGYGACTQGSLGIGAGGINSSNRIVGWTYDAAGNLLSYPGYGSYTYDAENRMKTTAGVTYTYDGDGRRVMKSNGKLYWYGAGSSVLMETDLSGNLQDEYIFFNGQRVARRTSAGVVYYFFSDHLGSNRIVTNASGGVVEDSDFFPFGAERVVTDTLNNNYKFTGHERDGESGLDFMGARHYAFTLGRFLQPDAPFADQSTANPQTWNLYAYARNNPLYFVDPSGRSGCPWSPCGMSAGGQLPAKQDWGIFGSASEYDGTPGFLSGWGEDNYFGWAFGGVNTESDLMPPRDFVGPLTESQQSTYDSIIHALKNTMLVDRNGKKLGSVLSLIRSIAEIRGEDSRLGSDQQFRLIVNLREGALDTLNKAAGFDKGRNVLFHKGFPISFRQHRESGVKGREAGLQISVSRDGARGDIDIDYRFGFQHFGAANSDVRAKGNTQKLIDRWPGLRPWWKE